MGKSGKGVYMDDHGKAWKSRNFMLKEVKENMVLF